MAYDNRHCIWAPPSAGCHLLATTIIATGKFVPISRRVRFPKMIGMKGPGSSLDKELWPKMDSWNWNESAGEITSNTSAKKRKNVVRNYHFYGFLFNFLRANLETVRGSKLEIEAGSSFSWQVADPTKPETIVVQESNFPNNGPSLSYVYLN